MKILVKISGILEHGEIKVLVSFSLALLLIMSTCTSCGVTDTNMVNESNSNRQENYEHKDKRADYSEIGWNIQNDGLYYNEKKKLEFKGKYPDGEPSFSENTCSGLVCSYIREDGSYKYDFSTNELRYEKTIFYIVPNSDNAIAEYTIIQKIPF